MRRSESTPESSVKGNQDRKCQSNCQFDGTSKKGEVVTCCPELRYAGGHKIQGDLGPSLALLLRDPPHLLHGYAARVPVRFTDIDPSMRSVGY